MTKSIDNNILIKLQRFCLYQVRCEQDIIKKLRSLKAPYEQDQKYLNHLKKEKYFDDKYFTNEFVNGKIKYNSWGKQKIKLALHGKKIDDKIIEDALGQIDNKDYSEIIKKLILKKIDNLNSKNKKEKSARIHRFMIQRGFYASDFMHILKSELE
jgi:regulatory protein